MPAAAVPHEDVVLQSGTDATAREAVALCLRLVPGWVDLRPEEVAVSVISGGITNSLLKLVPPGGRDPVVLRIFGLNTEVIIDRDRELKVLLQLNACGFGAPVLGTFTNGRVEAWLHARPLEPAELSDPALSCACASLVASFHLKAHVDGEEPVVKVWPLIREWLNTARGLVLDPPERQAVLLQIDMDQLAAEVDEVQAACDALHSPVVYSHNDLLAPNFLIQDPAPGDGSPAALYLIDFEYGCYNHRGFDLGNHFNEWAGFDCLYGQYPTDAQQRRFLGAYAAAAGLVGGEGGEAGSSRVVDALVVEANVFSLASHLYWGIWALIQAKYSAIDFDYLAYHGLRLAEMGRRKAEVLALGASSHHAA